MACSPCTRSLPACLPHLIKQAAKAALLGLGERVRRQSALAGHGGGACSVDLGGGSYGDSQGSELA